MASLSVTTAANTSAPQGAKAFTHDAPSDATPFAQLLNEATSRTAEKPHSQTEKPHTQDDNSAAATQQRPQSVDAAGGKDRKIHDGKKDSADKKSANDNSDDKDNDLSAQLTLVSAQPAATPAPQPDPSIQSALQVAMAQQNGTSGAGAQDAAGKENAAGKDAIPALQAAANINANANTNATGDEADDAQTVQPGNGKAAGAKPQIAAARQNQNSQPTATAAGNADDGDTTASAAEDAFKSLVHGKDQTAQNDAKPGNDQTSAKDTNPAQPAQAVQPPQAPAAPQPASAPAPQAMTAQAAAPAGASTQTTAGTQTTASVHVAPQTGAPNMGTMAVEIAARSQAGAKQFDIRLDPPELGRVEVRLSIDAAGKAQAHMTADQPQTLSLLQKDAPALTRALRDAGLDVSQSGLNFSLKGQDRQDNSGGGFQQSARGNALSLSASKSIEATPATSSFTSSGNARLDIHV